ncbi:MAG: SDR family NAD(P)-dependent oxidoreductase [Paracoccaceae bacterium]|nr:SDR family NAD(P)-dependent oxidoreductase [Paracoccaceae bacterium]
MTQKTVLITGANRGLGAALAKAAHGHAFKVIGTARKSSALDASFIDQGYDLDLSKADSIASFCTKIVKAGHPIDFLINNAGFNPKDRKDDPTYFQSTFKIAYFDASNVSDSIWINALAPMTLISKLLPILADDAVVLNISSWLGSIGGKTVGGHYGYAGSKALLNMFTRAVALELADTGRTAVALNPGWMRTDMGGDNAERSPDEVAKAVVDMWTDGTLMSKNGQFLNIDGTEHPW